MEENKLDLPHTTLYSKGWYKTSGDIISDLKKTLDADVLRIGKDFISEKDISRLLLNRLEKLGIPEMRLSTFIENVNRDNCWKFGYHTKDVAWKFVPEQRALLPDYELNTAIIHYCISTIRYVDMDKLSFCEPDENVLPLGDNSTMEKIKEYITPHLK